MPGVIGTPGLGLGVTLTVATNLFDQVQKISAPEVSVDTAETSVLASNWKTFIPALIDGGELTATVLFDYADTVVAAVLALVGSGSQACIIAFHIRPHHFLHSLA